MNIPNKKIQCAFSRAAKTYDQLSSLHKEIGAKLLSKINVGIDTPVILDVGMGTGFLTRQVKRQYPKANITGLDSSAGMIEYAHREIGINIVEADAQSLPFDDETFDLIVSNLAYQWVDDLPQALCEVYEKLKKNGKFYATMFGRDTFVELFASLENTMKNQGRDEKKWNYRLACLNKIESAVKQSGFSSCEIYVETRRMQYENMWALLRWIKGIGANTLKNGTYLGRDFLDQANKYYKQYFSEGQGVYATFEVIWIVGEK